MFRLSSKGRNLHLALRLRASKRMPMRLLKWKRKMPSTKQYNLVPNDDFDTRIPLHPDEAFQYGITFHAKYIGTMDVPRPSSRVEIVAAMRRVRYEFKAKGVKKRKVTVDVSTEGVRVTTRKKKSKTKRKEESKLFEEGNSKAPTEIMHHPIYRIFYVSHDSSDLKIFSYIARDGATNVFKCNVFKSSKKIPETNTLDTFQPYLGMMKNQVKSQAMRIVRTVGQAFEVCHKLANSADPVPSTSSAIEEIPADNLSDVPPSKEAISECGAANSGAACARDLPDDHLTAELLPPPPRKDGQRSPQFQRMHEPLLAIASLVDFYEHDPSPPTVDSIFDIIETLLTLFETLTVTTPTINLPDLPECVTKVDLACDQPSGDTSLSAQHQLQLLKERLEQQAQQTRAAVAQLLLLRDQLAAEQAARCEAQARTHQLLVHNKELLEHIAALVAHLQDRERGNTRSTINAQQLTMLPQATVNLAPQHMRTENYTTNSNRNIDTDALMGLMSQSHKITQNFENNNLRSSPFDVTPTESATPKNGPSINQDFTGLSNEHIQNYLINEFQNMGGYPQENAESKSHYVNNQQFYQNNTAFPNIPPLTNHYSNLDLSSLLNHNIYGSARNAGAGGQPADSLGAKSAMNLVNSQSSLFSASPAGTSKDSTPDGLSSDDGGVSFIMPLSHKATLTSASEDGRIRLIVPVSPSPSTAEVASASSTLRVPSSTITRTTSEKLSSSAKIDRWFSKLPAAPALSRPESGFLSGVEDGNDTATLNEARALLLHLGTKKKRRLLPIRLTRRKVLINKHTML